MRPSDFLTVDDARVSTFLIYLLDDRPDGRPDGRRDCRHDGRRGSPKILNVWMALRGSISYSMLS